MVVPLVRVVVVVGRWINYDVYKYDTVKVSIILPVLNEALVVAEQLRLLKEITDSSCEIIVVDGGSDDNTAALARPFANTVIVSSEKGRAVQMNAGAALAKGTLLFFLHLDTQLPDNFLSLLKKHDHYQWGFFRVLLSGSLWPFRIIEKMMNIRSYLSAVATGDQCLFIRRDVFSQINGFAEIPLMEDVEICKRLRAKSSPLVIDTPVITSSRRWEKGGIITTVLLMWRLRFAYFLGVSPEKLVRWYYS